MILPSEIIAHYSDYVRRLMVRGKMKHGTIERLLDGVLYLVYVQEDDTSFKCEISIIKEGKEEL